MSATAALSVPIDDADERAVTDRGWNGGLLVPPDRLASSGRRPGAVVRPVPGVVRGARRVLRQLVAQQPEAVAGVVHAASVPQADRRLPVLAVVRELARDQHRHRHVHGAAGRVGGVPVLAHALPRSPGGPAVAAADPDVPGVARLRRHLHHGPAHVVAPSTTSGRARW